MTKFTPKPRPPRHYAAAAVSEFDRHLAARIKMARVSRDLSRARFADMIGISESQLEKWESAENRVFAAHIQMISQALEVPPSWFFEAYADSSTYVPPDDDAANHIYDQRVLRLFRRMSPEHQAMVRKMMSDFGDADQGPGAGTPGEDRKAG